MGVERLENIAGNQRMVNTSIFVGMETFEVLLPNVHHLGYPKYSELTVCCGYDRRGRSQVQEFREVPFQG